MIIGYPGPKRRSPDYYALNMIDAILTLGDSARLRQDLVKGKQSVIQYEANLGWPFASTLDYRDPEPYALFLLYKPNFTAEQIVGQVQDEMAKLQNQPIDAEGAGAHQDPAPRHAHPRAAELAHARQDARPIHDRGRQSGADQYRARRDAGGDAGAGAGRREEILCRRKTGGARHTAGAAPRGAQTKGGPVMLSRTLIAMALAAGTLAAQTVDRTKPPQTPPIPGYKLPPVYETKLPNGLGVVLVEDARFPLVTVRLNFQAGSKFDPKDMPGLAEAVASAAHRRHQDPHRAPDLRGDGRPRRHARRRRRRRLADRRRQRALGESSATADTRGRCRRATRASRRTRSTSTSRTAFRACLAQRAEPGFLAEEKMAELVYGSSPYGHIAPTAAAIQKLDGKTLAGFRDTYLVPNNATLLIVGKLPARDETDED